MTIRAMYQDSGMDSPLTLAPSDYSDALKRRRGCLWIDILDEPREVIEPILKDTFGFHPLAIEDALLQSHIPKIDAWENYLYIVLHSPSRVAESEPAGTAELDLFVGSHFVVTYRTAASRIIDRVWSTASQTRAVLPRGPAHILYRIIDEAESEFVPLFDSIDERIGRIESDVFREPNRELLSEIFGLKRSILALRRIMSPQREVIGKLSRGAYAQFSPEEQRYFHDVYDHMIQLADTLENLRDLVNGTLEIHLSAASNRLNEVLKTLTMITTLFMPLTFIAGFFGMNFFRPTGEFLAWTGESAFAMSLALMLATPLTMYLWIRSRGST